ncbi:phosphate acetyltransferase [bacterium]|nr:phosphate acetyltransferase [bacterium]
MKLFATLPSDVRDRLFALAHSARVGLPEFADPRVIEAARMLRAEAGVEATLISPEVISSARVQTDAVIQQRAKKRGKSLPQEHVTWLDDPFFAAGAMLEMGQLDAVVGGAVATTAHVIRAALNTVGIDAHAPLITSCFLFKLREPTAGGEDVVLYADAGVVPQPSDAQLVQIAELATEAFARWTGREPRVGFLSFSTLGSAEHADVQKVRGAANTFAQKNPHVLSEGELQFDAAVVPEVALRKNPSSRLAGRTNVFVFPDLDAGNIAYKITQRLAGAEAWGPLLLGTAKPFSDLSRGASAQDIAHVALLTLALRPKV